MRPTSVDEYIATTPKAIQPKLQQLRQLIKSIAPTAEERVSYGMPYYDYQGRLVYFALMKNHIGLYIPPPIIEQYKEQLKAYGITKSAVHLSIEKELPTALITALVKARMTWNEKMSAKK
jgi:uncharacterized protein YdhG (YjbR/CyaY superfamily)